MSACRAEGVTVILRSDESADASPTRRVFETADVATVSRFSSAEQVEAWCPDEHDEVAWAQTRSTAWTVAVELSGEVVGLSDLRDDGELDVPVVVPFLGG